jgi:hypothetical protein
VRNVSLVRVLGLALAAAALGSTGCIYSQHVVNEHVRGLDAGRIVVGETTVLDVLNTWGPPPPLTPAEFTRHTDPSLFHLSSRYMRYVNSEIKCTSFLLTVPPPFRFGPVWPFAWCDHQPVYALVLEFDERGIVRRVSRGQTEVVWRPWNSGADRAVSVETISTPGGVLQ